MWVQSGKYELMSCQMTLEPAEIRTLNPMIESQMN